MEETERVRNVLAIARDEASRLHHEYVGTEHILLALIREGGGVAARVLQNLEVDLPEIQRKVEAVVKKGNAPQASDLPYTTRAKKVLELAMAEACDLSHSYLGTEHLFLGVLREERGIAAQILVHGGISLDAARAETLRLLGSEMPQRAADSRGERPSEDLRYLVPAALLHDLRTPLSQMLGYSEMLLEQAEEAGNADFVRDLGKIRAAGWKLLALMDANFQPSRAALVEEDAPDDAEPEPRS